MTRRNVAAESYKAEFKVLDEREQSLFEAWLAGTLPPAMYVLEWRKVDKLFAQLEAKREETARDRAVGMRRP